MSFTHIACTVAKLRIIIFLQQPAGLTGSDGLATGRQATGRQADRQTTGKQASWLAGRQADRQTTGRQTTGRQASWLAGRKAGECIACNSRS